MNKAMFPNRAVKAIAAIAVLALGPVAVALAQDGVTRHYYTELYRYPEGGFPTSATMDLTFRANGTIVGYYRPTDGGLRTVSGSISGERIALSIGGLGGIQVNGTMTSDGRIEGRAFTAFGHGLFSFIGRPIPNDHTLPHVP